MKDSMVPNTTPTPNIIFDEWMPILKDVEFRLLCIVTRQTMGWVEDPLTGRRKEHDWISHSQLIFKSGKKSSSISDALKVLIDHYAIIEALNSKGELLDSSTKRRYGGKIFYRLNLHSPPPTLFTFFSPQLVSRRRGKRGDKEGEIQATIPNFGVVPSQNLDTTKETYTKITNRKNEDGDKLGKETNT
jgi:hypothetical protein